MADGIDRDRLRRLSAARTAGQVPPPDLLPWLIEMAASIVGAKQLATHQAPVEHLTTQVSAEVERWMTRRRVTPRTIGVARRNVNRCLKGDNVTIGTVSDVADALGCEVVLRFRPVVGIYGATSGVYGARPFRAEPDAAHDADQEKNP